MTWRAIFTLAAVVCALAAASASSARDPRDVTLRPVAHDVAVAKTLLLTRADVPAGFKQTAWSLPPSAELGCKTYKPDDRGVVETAQVIGHRFDFSKPHGSWTIGSVAVVYRARADARADWKASVTNPKMTPCLVEAVSKGLKPLTLTAVKVKRSTGSGSAMTVEIWHESALAQPPSNVRPTRMDIIMMFFLKGRAASAITLSGAGSGLARVQDVLVAAARKLVLAQSKLR